MPNNIDSNVDLNDEVTSDKVISAPAPKVSASKVAPTPVVNNNEEEEERLRMRCLGY